MAESVPFDVVRRGTVFEERCAACGRYFAVAGATPVMLRTSSSLPDRLLRTDLEFGAGDEQHPLIVMGAGLAERLRGARLAGVDFGPVIGA